MAYSRRPPKPMRTDIVYGFLIFSYGWLPSVSVHFWLWKQTIFKDSQIYGTPSGVSGSKRIPRCPPFVPFKLEYSPFQTTLCSWKMTKQDFHLGNQFSKPCAFNTSLDLGHQPPYCGNCNKWLSTVNCWLFTCFWMCLEQTLLIITCRHSYRA